MDEEKALTEIEDDDVKALIDQFDPEFKKNFSLSESELSRLKRGLRRKVLSESNSVPMICRGSNCVASKRCPLLDLDKAPIGKICPLEKMLVNKWKDDYIESLGLDWNDAVERKLAGELIEIDILQARANSILSEEGFIMENAVGVDEQTGEPVYRKEKHIAMDVKNTLYNRRSKVLKEMMATRESKAKFMEDLKGDPSEYASKLRSKFEKLQEDHDVEVVDAEDFEEIEDEKNK